MMPESDPSAAFSVTRNTNTAISGQAGVSLSQVPSGNVSLGLSRSTELTVQYAVGSWSVSAHRVVNSPGQDNGASKSIGRVKNPHEHEQKRHWDNSSSSYNPQLARYQWFWAGTQQETKKLTPDLKHTVKRHVVVKRIVPFESLSFDSVTNETGEEQRPSQEAGTVLGATEEAPSLIGMGDSNKKLSERQLRALERCFEFSFRVKVRY